MSTLIPRISKTVSSLKVPVKTVLVGNFPGPGHGNTISKSLAYISSLPSFVNVHYMAWSIDDDARVCLDTPNKVVELFGREVTVHHGMPTFDAGTKYVYVVFLSSPFSLSALRDIRNVPWGVRYGCTQIIAVYHTGYCRYTPTIGTNANHHSVVRGWTCQEHLMDPTVLHGLCTPLAHMMDIPASSTMFGLARTTNVPILPPGQIYFDLGLRT